MFYRIACVLLLALGCAGAQASQMRVSSLDKNGKLHCELLPQQKEVDCPDRVAFEVEGQAPVQDAFEASKFDKLDALYAQWCQGKDRLPDGSWNLLWYAEALKFHFRTANNWDRDLRTIQAWQHTHPNSEAARLAEAEYWRSYAWSARGEGYANTVSEQGWELYRQRLVKSREILDAIVAAGSSCPLPYSQRMSVMSDMETDPESIAEAFEQASAKFPEYQPLYIAMARHFEPKWGGRAADFERFAREAARRTAKLEGMGMYARLYALVDEDNGIPFTGKAGSAPSWSGLEAGYEDLLRRYPASHSLLLSYLSVVCRTGDDALYRSLRPRAIGFEDDTLYRLPVSLVDCDVRHHWTPPKSQGAAPGQPQIN